MGSTEISILPLASVTTEYNALFLILCALPGDLSLPRNELESLLCGRWEKAVVGMVPKVREGGMEGSTDSAMTTRQVL